MTHPPRMGPIDSTQNDGQYYKLAYLTGALIGQSEDANKPVNFDDREPARSHRANRGRAPALGKKKKRQNC
jgi:hypothetical protein